MDPWKSKDFHYTAPDAEAYQIAYEIMCNWVAKNLSPNDFARFVENSCLYPHDLEPRLEALCQMFNLPATAAEIYELYEEAQKHRDTIAELEEMILELRTENNDLKQRLQ